MLRAGGRRWSKAERDRETDCAAAGLSCVNLPPPKKFRRGQIRTLAALRLAAVILEGCRREQKGELQPYKLNPILTEEENQII